MWHVWKRTCMSSLLSTPLGLHRQYAIFCKYLSCNCLNNTTCETNGLENMLPICFTEYTNTYRPLTGATWAKEAQGVNFSISVLLALNYVGRNVQYGFRWGGSMHLWSWLADLANSAMCYQQLSLGEFVWLETLSSSRGPSTTHPDKSTIMVWFIKDFCRIIT